MNRLNTPSRLSDEDEAALRVLYDNAVANERNTVHYDGELVSASFIRDVLEYRARLRMNDALLGMAPLDIRQLLLAEESGPPQFVRMKAWLREGDRYQVSVVRGSKIFIDWLHRHRNAICAWGQGNVASQTE